MADQLLYSLASESEQLGKCGVSERITFSGALDLDKLAAIGHHDIEIHIGRGVFAVIEIEQRNPANYSDTHGRDMAAHRADRKFSGFQKTVYGETESNIGAGYRSRTR